jgi:hypothetical protein
MITKGVIINEVVRAKIEAEPAELMSSVDGIDSIGIPVHIGVLLPDASKLMLPQDESSPIVKQHKVFS